jgi:hypothetical protein
MMECGATFLPLAAEPLSADRLDALTSTRPTSPLKTRVRGSRCNSSGRSSPRGRRRREIATGSRGCGYKTASGRSEWLNRDPIEEDGGINLYAFVENDPVNSSDPLGEQLYPPLILCPNPFPPAPCRVVCSATGPRTITRRPIGPVIYRVGTIPYTCTDCRGNTWQEFKRVRSLTGPRFNFRFPPRIPPPIYTYPIDDPGPPISI